MKYSLLWPVYAFCVSTVIFSCGKIPSRTEHADSGTVQVRVWVANGLKKQTKPALTSWDSLVVQVDADDMDPVVESVRFNSTELYSSISLENIPAGENRDVHAWTLSATGDTIHHGHTEIAEVLPQKITNASIELYALRGSIVVNLIGLPTSVDSVFAVFTSEGTEYVSSVTRASLTFISIDNVPDGSVGELVVKGLDENGVLVYEDSVTLTYSTHTNQTLEISHGELMAALALDVRLENPAITLINAAYESAYMGIEEGPLMISEIMYYALGDSDYIEVYNPQDTAVSFDSLMLEIQNSSSTDLRIVRNIDISPHSCFVIGDIRCPWADTSFSMDLTTTGRWIELKTVHGTVVDRVVYTKTENEWPSGVRYGSIECRGVSFLENNFGRFWENAQEPIPESDHVGTPGTHELL